MTLTFIDRPARGDDRTPGQRYDASPKGAQRKRDYRHNRSKWQTDAHYLSREFIAWDGEGITLDDGKQTHVYVMLANSKGGYIANPDGLPTRVIFEFILSEYAKYPDAWHVIYGGGYDANMWLTNVPKAVIEGIYSHDYYHWGDYTIQWRRGKSFYLRKDSASEYTKGVTIYDSVSFFQTSFVKACDSYLAERFAYRDNIVANKALRSSFTEADIPMVREYNRQELVNLVALMVELRARLNAVTLRPRRWDGPGAIAAALLTRECVKHAMAETPANVQEAARYAYAGGRFEPIQYGISQELAYEYDINSAYPFALQHVPNLSRGRWEQCPPGSHATEGDVDPQELQHFALYHVRFTGGDYRLPMPLFWRSYKGNIVYPGDKAFTGWYWGPDVQAAMEYVARYHHQGARVEILGCKHFLEDNPDDRPFHFVAELYRQRQLLKAVGDGAHVGIKLGLNSLYGKLAQQVGARRDPASGLLTKPPFHQLEWAGYVTATCRSMVYRAAIDDLSSVIAYETDALFTSEPLDVPIGTGLGEWEQTVFTDLTYVQSGMYFGTRVTEDGGTEQVAKTRGVNLGSLTRENVEDHIYSDGIASAPLTQFITAGQALQGRWGQWRKWITADKTISLIPGISPEGVRQGKREALCGEPTPGRFSPTYATRVPPSHSAQFPVAWINPDPNMSKLDELREGYK